MFALLYHDASVPPSVAALLQVLPFTHLLTRLASVTLIDWWLSKISLKIIMQEFEREMPPTDSDGESRHSIPLLRNSLVALPFEEGCQVLKAIDASDRALKPESVDAMQETLTVPFRFIDSDDGTKRLQRVMHGSRNMWQRLANVLTEEAWDWLMQRAKTAEDEATKFLDDMHSLPPTRHAFFVDRLLHEASLDPGLQSFVYKRGIQGRSWNNIAKDIGPDQADTSVRLWGIAGYRQLFRYASPALRYHLESTLDRMELASNYTPHQLLRLVEHLPDATRQEEMTGTIQAAKAEGALSEPGYEALATARLVYERLGQRRKAVEFLGVEDESRAISNSIVALCMPNLSKAMFQRLCIMTAPHVTVDMTKDELINRLKGMPPAVRDGMLESLAVRACSAKRGFALRTGFEGLYALGDKTIDPVVRDLAERGMKQITDIIGRVDLEIFEYFDGRTEGSLEEYLEVAAKFAIAAGGKPYELAEQRRLTLDPLPPMWLWHSATGGFQHVRAMHSKERESSVYLPKVRKPKISH